MRLREKIAKFMYGRYGVDALSQFLMWAAIAVMVVNIFARNGILSLLVMVVIIIVYARMFSKNYSKCRAQNDKYLKIRSNFMKKINSYKDIKTHHIYTCKSCKQKIRIPRGKGKIMVRCPKCGFEFMKRS